MRALAGLALVCALPAVGAAQETRETDLRSNPVESVALEARAGAVLSGETLSRVTEPGFSVGLGAAVPVSQDLFVRVDGDLHLPERDVTTGPQIEIYSGIASLEYVARQQTTGRLPFRTALTLGMGVSVVDAVEMPAAAPSGSTFQESYLTLSGGVRVGYPVTSRLEIYAASDVRWFDLGERDWEQLTEGMSVAQLTPGNGWLVPLRAGLRLAL